MAKMTSTALAEFVESYVDASKIAGQWTASQNNFVGLLDKVGKQITIDGIFNDRLPELNGEDLPLGKTIEEYFIDLTLPEAFSNITTEGAKDHTPAIPSVEQVSYCYTLGRNKIKTTVPYDNFERAMVSSAEVGNLAAKIVERLQNSYDLARYAAKKQLLGRAADKAITAGCVETVAMPTDTTTGEAFIRQVKTDVEEASFAHEGGIAGALIGAAPSLTLYVKKGVMPSVEVDTLAGAFNKEDLAMGVNVKVVDDFGDMDNDCWAILVDPRGIKLHSGYQAIRTSENADGDFVNYVKHYEDTGFVSKYCYIKAYTAN